MLLDMLQTDILILKLSILQKTDIRCQSHLSVSNDLYVIPAKYSTKGKNDNNVGFNVQSSDRNKGESKIYYPPIAYADDENYYVSRLYFNDGEVITKPDSHETYVIGHTRKFMGAYNINNGYTVFTVVSILAQHR